MYIHLTGVHSLVDRPKLLQEVRLMRLEDLYERILASQLWHTAKKYHNQGLK
jgi:hypothetical protein